MAMKRCKHRKFNRIRPAGIPPLLLTSFAVSTAKGRIFYLLDFTQTLTRRLINILMSNRCATAFEMEDSLSQRPV